jgi:prevent-host-death family protein
MSDTFSLYDAKARFSELIRRVREGRTITISYRGEPVAEVRPVTPSMGLAGRLRELEQRGALLRADATKATLKRVAKRPGALARFLAERDRS